MIHEIHYAPIDYQAEFQDSIKPKVFLSTGYGGGKTYSLVMKALKLCSQNAGLAGGLLAPTLKSFKRDVLPIFREICDENGVNFRWHGSDHYLYLYDTRSTIYIFHAEDKGASIRGPNLAWGAINEVTLIDKESFDAFLARIRIKKASMRQLVMSGTPEQFNWAYEYFVENPRDDTDLIFGDMRLNTYISDDYANMLMDSYDAKMVEAYVEGKFVSLLGSRACHAFDRHKHTDNDIEKIPLADVWVSLDFNVEPMSAVLWNRMPIDSRYQLQAFGEICMGGSNTYEMAQAIKDRTDPDDHIVIFPDPAGKARSTKTRGKSDIDILEKEGFDDIRFKPRIQSVRDCLNALNNLFDKDKIRINAKACKNFVADLEQCTIKQGTFEIDKKNPKRTHWLDGAKNMADYEFPIRIKRGHWTKQIR